MRDSPIDAVDRAILYRLQADARRTITEIADYANVSDNTVRNRIQRLEERGIIRGYSVDIDYHETGIQHYFQFICTARVSERETLADRVLEIPGVVEVRTLMTGTRNIQITAVGTGIREITDIAYRIDELGLGIDQESLIHSSTQQPLEKFELNFDYNL